MAHACGMSPVAGTDYVIDWGSVSKASASNTASSWVVASDGYYYWTSPGCSDGQNRCAHQERD